MRKKWPCSLLILCILTIGLPSHAHAFNEFGTSVVSLLIILIIVAVIFLVFREFFCWYWKINETLSALKQIRDLLSAIVSKATEEVAFGQPPSNNSDKKENNDSNIESTDKAPPDVLTKELCEKIIGDMGFIIEKTAENEWHITDKKKLIHYLYSVKELRRFISNHKTT